MGLETIVFEAAGAGAMAALAPTAAIIRPGTQDAYIVAVCPMGATLTSVTLTAAQDSRWDAAGLFVSCAGNGGIQDAFTFNQCVTQKKIPVRRGVTLAAVSVGGGVSYCFVWVEYPDIGPKYAPRDPSSSQEIGQMTFRTAIAGAALGANVITANSVAIVNFTEGRHYTPVGAELNAVMVGPEIAVGFTDPKTNLITFWPLAIAVVVKGGQTRQVFPYGMMTPLTRGETLQVHYVSANADTPTTQVIFAHDSQG